MSSVGKKPLYSDSMNSRPSGMPTSSRSPSFRSSSSNSTATNGVNRVPSVRGNNGLSRPSRGSVRRTSPNTSFPNTNTSVSDDANEEDARAENGALMNELRNRLRKAETTSEEYQRHLAMLQTRLDDSLQQQGMLEDRVQENIGAIEALEIEKTQAARQRREMESNFEAERISIMKDKNEMKAKEEELLAVNQRLKETLAQRETRYSIDEDQGLPRSRKSYCLESKNIDI